MEENNPFLKFKATQKRVAIKALGVEVVLQQPTIAQSNAYSAELYTGTDESGKPQIDMKKVTTANLGKIASCLVDPKMSLEELQSLGMSADKAISEILREIDDWDGSDRAMEKQAKELATTNGTNWEDELSTLRGN